jgi:hypothetical protein
MVKYEKVELRAIYRTETFRGAVHHYLNYRNSKENLIIFGAPIHEYYWGQYDNEEYHEFCFKDVNTKSTALGLFGSK